MKTFLYDTITQKRQGEIREGRYLVDGQPGILPQNWVELVIEDIDPPSYNESTQTLVFREYADIPNLKWIRDSYVRDLTPQEIQDRLPKPPETCTPRQFRLALIDSGYDLNQIQTMLENIPNEVERKKAIVEWEYSIEIVRTHPLISTFAEQLGLTETDLDNIFFLSETYQ